MAADAGHRNDKGLRDSCGACAAKCAASNPETNPGAPELARIGADYPELAGLLDVLAQLPEPDRLATAEHVAALAGMAPARRAAILMLAKPDPLPADEPQ